METAIYWKEKKQHDEKGVCEDVNFDKDLINSVSGKVTWCFTV